MIKGNVHSTETFGSVDGPGVRFVIFLQGCPMRCLYCHNADTQSTKPNRLMTAGELLDKAERYRSYWGSEGGITVSGGEPLLQTAFLVELFTKAKERGINTCLDTSGQPFTRKEPFFTEFCRLLEVTDLILADIKHIDPGEHRRLTGHGNENILDMLRFLSEREIPVWIRHVLVTGYTDRDDWLRKTREFTDTLKNVKKTEVLPYHSLGAYKWKELGRDYPLENVQPPDAERIKNAERILCG